jgi:hypothetical protein
MLLRVCCTCCACCVLGSVLCRDEAQKLWAERAALEAAGLKVVCVVHEWIDREVSGATNRSSSTFSHTVSGTVYWMC